MSDLQALPFLEMIRKAILIKMDSDMSVTSRAPDSTE